MCGEMLSDQVILGRRNGPRRLRDKDNRDELFRDIAKQTLTVTVNHHGKSVPLSCEMLAMGLRGKDSPLVV